MFTLLIIEVKMVLSPCPLNNLKPHIMNDLKNLPVFSSQLS